jgi:putative hydrolase of the HAD superfamily
MIIEMIGFDADDTLWHTETHYLQAQEAFRKLLSPWATADHIDKVLDQININNLPQYGYGIKAFVLSLVEAAIQISRGEISADQISHIVSIGKRMLATEIVLRPHVIDTLQALVASYPLMIITKGDLLDQTTKIERARLGDYFSSVAVVNEKTAESYANVLGKYRIEPQNFLMVGNSIRSDIHPVLALGGTAVHIPADSTWEHEIIPGFDTTQDRFYELDHMGQLAELIARISAAD